MSLPNPQVCEEDVLRAQMYGLLAALLARAPSPELLKQTGQLLGDETQIGRAIDSLSALARKLSPQAVEREYTTLFIGIGRGELLPFASYYMTGFLNEKPLARLRADMTRLRIARDPAVFEPEDNIASLCEMMAGLITGRFGAPLPLAEQRAFFNTHLAPWMVHFFTDLEAAKASVFYAPLGTLGRVFAELEAKAFKMTGD